MRSVPTRRGQFEPAEIAEAGADFPIVWIKRGGALEISGAARRLLALPEGGAASLAVIFTSLRNGGEALERRLSRLVSDGASFSTIVETVEGRVIEAVGAPYGVDAGIILHDQTELRRRVGAMEAQVEMLKCDLETARALDSAAEACAWRTSAEGEVVWENGGFARLPGAARRRMKEASVSEGPFLLNTDGQTRSYLSRFVETEDGGRVTVCFEAVELNRTELAMRRLVETMSETFAHLNVSLMLFDDHMRLVLFNPATVKMLEADTAWLASKPDLRSILDRLRRNRNLPDHVDFGAWRDTIVEFAQSTDNEVLEELWHLHDGRSLKARFRAHEIGGLALVVEDVTEEMALRRSHASEQAMRSASSDVLEEGLAIFGPDGLLRMANGAMRRIWALDASRIAPGVRVEAVARDCAMLTADDAFWPRLIGAATHSGVRVERSQRLRLRDGRWLKARLSPLPDGSLLTVFSDNTASENFAVALRERNEALEHADEMRSALIDQISHQMRTPLNSICGFGRLLQDPRYGDLNQAQREYVDCIVASSGDLIEAIDSMADLISVGADAYFDGDETFSPHQSLAEVASLAAQRVGERAAKVRIETQGVSPFVGRRARVRQIMFNMLMDAMSHTGVDDEVLFTLDSRDGALTMRCRHPLSARAEEQGLALALVRRFSLLCGGVVEVDVSDKGLREVVCRMIGEQPDPIGRGAHAGDRTARH